MAQVQFWRSFAAESVDLACRLLNGDSQAVFDRIDALMDANGLEWCFDVTSDGKCGHLILSPEGNHDIARLIDRFLECAPELPLWKLFGGRQRKPLQDVRAIILDFYYLDLLECSCQIRYDVDVRTVQLSMPDDPHQMTEAEKDGLINTLLWHAIGERFVMDNDIRGEVLVAANHCSLSVFDMVMELTGVKPY